MLEYLFHLLYARNEWKQRPSKIALTDITLAISQQPWERLSLPLVLTLRTFLDENESKSRGLGIHKSIDPTHMSQHQLTILINQSQLGYSPDHSSHCGHDLSVGPFGLFSHANPNYRQSQTRTDMWKEISSILDGMSRGCLPQ